LAVRSKPLNQTIINVPTSSTLLYEGPSGETPLIKFVTLFNRHATNNVTITVGLGGTAAAGNDGTIFTETLAPREVKRFEVFIPLKEGGKVSAISSTSSAGTVRLFGAELEGVAD